MTEHASTEEGKMTVSHDVADAGEASLAMLDSLALPSSSAGSGLPALQMPTLAGLQPPTLNPLPRVPTEPAPLENGIKQEPAEHELRTRPKEILKTLQDQNLEIGKAILSLQTIKYTTELQADMKAHEKKLKRLIALLEAHSEKPKEAPAATITKLDNQIKAHTKVTETLMESAENFGVFKQPAQKTRAQKRRRVAQ